MGSMEELEGRVSALETQMHTVRQDSAAARVLAGGADRDVSGLTTRMDANVRLLEALRETQVEDHQAIGQLRRGFAILLRRVSGLEAGQSEVGDRLSGLEAGQSGLQARQSGLEDRFSGLEDRFSGLEGRFSGLEGRFSGLEDRFPGLEDRFSGLEGRFFGLEQGQAQILDLLRRRNGEGPPAPAE